MRLLAIESSCDETAVAIVDENTKLLADEVSTQIERHAPFGGVVPEIASREHMATLALLTERALQTAGCTYAELDAIAVTLGPGLIGSLFVGVMFAKGLALARKLPLVTVNHLEGHLSAVDLLETKVAFPHVALLVSGGHTALYRVEGPFSVKTLGVTLDDAAGEAFDKTAKMLGLGYPGGAKLSRTAEGGNTEFWPLPLALRDRLDFSFSGLKTAVNTHLQKLGQPPSENILRDVCASIENAIVSALVAKAKAACEREGIKTLVLGGGVAANGPLRDRCEKMMTALGGKSFAPPKAWCTDNAAMIAAAGMRRFLAGRVGGLDCAPKAYWPLEEALSESPVDVAHV
jgi:N6-L-threonylcarbamoyladenine synthase